MKFTLSALKQFVKCDLPAAEIAKILTRIGLEVEEVHDFGATYNPFIIAEIKDAKRHENAEKLQVCTVFDGKQELQIVCGAPNARAGLKVVLAPVGAMIPNGNFQIKAAKIRGVDSCGMLCSAEELNLGAPSEGIIELPADAPVGSSYAEFANLNDAVIEIAITPNRGDAASVYGIARDLYAAGGASDFKNVPAKALNYSGSVALEIIAQDLCSEFILAEINGVSNTQDDDSQYATYLKKVGSSPKGKLVNISNHSMFMFGRPNHVYDKSKVKGKVVVRLSAADEHFVAIGGEEFKLPEGLLVVADDEKVLAIAGVMGGELSKVTESTTDILVEVANFDAVAVAKAGRALNLLSDSRYRFERRVDLGLTDFFADYMIAEILKSAGGKLIGATKKTGAQPQYTKEVSFAAKSCESLSGTAIAENVVAEILEKLGFKKAGASVIVPSHRAGDINMERDLVEEVLRIYGLDNIASQEIPLSFKDQQIKPREFENMVRNILASSGYTELMTWSFTSEKLSRLFGFKHNITVANPISQDMSIMRETQLPEMLMAAKLNLGYGTLDACYFEIGNNFHKAEPNGQHKVISGLMVGSIERKSHFHEERKYDFFDAKAAVWKLISAYGFDPEKLKIEAGECEYYHPGKSAKVMLGKQEVAKFGVLHPGVLAAMDVEANACAFEINVDNLPKIRENASRPALDISYLQVVSRDFAFLVDANVAAQDVIKQISNINPSETESVNIFDVYTGDKVEQGKKSIAINILLRPKTATYTDKQLEEFANNVTSTMQSKFNAIQR